MLRTHPESNADIDALSSFIRVASDCDATCTLCADACLSEDKVSMLVECIRLNLNCADTCAATARVAARLTEMDSAAMRHQLESCAQACSVCAGECERHASKHEHCRICAEACRDCESECREFLEHVRAVR
jgi:hypothetical protein